MKILITGATGLIGSRLVERLIEKNHSVVAVSRSEESARRRFGSKVNVVVADLSTETLSQEKIKDVEAVIHLMGENIAAGRWTKSQKEKIYTSRIDSSRNLLKSFKGLALKSMISASAVGYYGDRKDEELTEESSSGSGFLAEICKEWEKVFQDKQGEFPQTRFVQVRIGVVLSKTGGALEKMKMPFKLGLGGALGSGQQWMSWIHLEDLVNLFIHLLDREDLRGPVNAVSPNPVKNIDFSSVLAARFGKSLGPRVPEMALKLLLGEMSQVVLSSTKVLPRRLLHSGFQFKYSDLSSALKEL
jgi:uncharacterized protein (TIGR01777 family)